MAKELLHPAFIILGVCFLIQVITYLGIFGKFAFYRPEVRDQTDLKPVSIIISAKNEDENLKRFLPAILEQDYPEFEVIVVNDQSEDDTEFVLNELELKYPNLNRVLIKDHINDFPGKKLAIMLGIKKAKYNQLVFTDADCKPAGNQWLRFIASHFDKDTEIILGYSPYFRKNSFLNLLIQFDTFYTALQYFSFFLKGKPYMGVGRNLSYTKELFMKKGFSSHLHIPFGDDDLFVNKNAHYGNTAIEIMPESHVFSLPKESYAKWQMQKIRHLKAGKEYKPEQKRILGYIWLSQVIFYLAFAAALVFLPTSYFVWGIFLLKIILTLIIYGKSLSKLNQKYLIFFTPLLDPVYHLFIVPNLSIAAMASKRNTW